MVGYHEISPHLKGHPADGGRTEHDRVIKRWERNIQEGEGLKKKVAAIEIKKCFFVTDLVR